MTTTRDRGTVTMPGWTIEREFWRRGLEAVAGVDEVGRGPIAGPVFAGAVVLRYSRASWVGKLRDSKQLSARAREQLAVCIRESSDCAVAGVSSQVIDQIGIVPATRLAMRRAVLRLETAPSALIVDGREVVECEIEQRAVIRADARCVSVAAASIIAKVARDELMGRLGQEIPGYGLAGNKGYASRDHLDALRRLGPSTAHRLSWRPVRAAIRDHRR